MHPQNRAVRVAAHRRHRAGVGVSEAQEAPELAAEEAYTVNAGSSVLTVKLSNTLALPALSSPKAPSTVAALNA